MVFTSCDPYKKSTERRIVIFLSVDLAGEQCKRLATRKLLKGNKVAVRVFPVAQQNDEP